MSIAFPVEEITIGARAPEKRAPGNLGTPCNFKTNVSKITLTPNLAIYKYDVEVNLIFEKKNKEEAKKSLTKGAQNDCLAQSRAKLANKVLKLVFDKNLAKYKNIDLFYDSRASLYSTIQINDFTDNIDPKKFAEIDDQCKNVEVKISRVADSHQVTTGDTKLTVDPVFGKADVTLLEALNTMISQSLENKDNLITYKGTHFLLDTDSVGFQQRDLPRLDGGQYTGVGISETVKTLEGDKQGSRQLHCVIDLKKTAFHSDYQPLMEKMQELLCSKNERLNKRTSNHDAAARYLKEKLKGMVVRLDYGENKKKFEKAKWFIIGGFGPSAAEKRIPVKDGDKMKEMTIVQYFKFRFNITLQYPDFFTVYDRTKKDTFFPPELLIIGENQRATTQQLTRKGQEDLVKVSAILPKIRSDQTAKVAQYVGIDGNNKEMERVGIHVEKNPLTVTGRVLPTPIISATGGNVNVVKNCNWKLQKYKKCAKLEDWSVYSIDAGIDIKIFMEHIKRRVISSGMTWNDPRITTVPNNQRVDIEKILADEKKVGTKFVFFVARDTLNLHQNIKLYEQKYDILTQEVRASTARRVIERGQVQTVENIVHKMNLKLGGVNFEVTGYNVSKPGVATDYLHPKYGILIFGFESSRSIGDNLVAVGYSANATENPQNFVGNYKFVKNHKDTYGQVLKIAIHEMVKKFKEKRPTPAQLYFYFNGVSEGQLGMIANDYVDRIKQACLELNENFRPQITIMCVSKTPSERLANEKIVGVKAAEQNIAPGSCVDTGIVSPVINEFFLNSHSAFQGTARTPKYSLVFDTTQMPMNAHEGLAHQLCFLHGIVTSTTSLPVPIIVADRCATRGASNYHTSGRADNQSVVSGNSGMSQSAFDELNEQLTYTGKALSNFRFNA